MRNNKGLLVIIILVSLLSFSQNIFAENISNNGKYGYDSLKKTGYDLYLYYSSSDFPGYSSLDDDGSYATSEFHRTTARLVTKNNWAWEINIHHSIKRYYGRLEDDSSTACLLFGKDWDMLTEKDYRLKLHLLLGGVYLLESKYDDEYEMDGRTGVEIRTGSSFSYKYAVIALDFTIMASDFDILANIVLGIGVHL